MGRLQLFFVLLLVQTFSSYTHAVYQKALVKTIGKEPDVTPICSNETMNFIIVLVCRISTGMNRGDECRLAYRHLRGFDHGCDSRFTFVTVNQTVFLHLNDLTPEDSGNYTCECSRPDGTVTLYLNITVEEIENSVISIETHSSNAKIGVIIFIIAVLTGFILGVAFDKICQRKLEPVTRDVQYNPVTYREAVETEPYNVVIQKENVLYSTCKYSHL